MSSRTPSIVFLLATSISCASLACSSSETPAAEPFGDAETDTGALPSDRAAADTSVSPGDSSADSAMDSSAEGATDSGGEVALDAGPPSPGFELLDFAIAVDLTPDGRFAVLEDLGATADVWVYDTVTKTKTKKTTVGDPSADLATGISATGRISALHGIDVNAAYWDEPKGWTDIASPYPVGCDINRGGAWDVSADGTVLVGMMWKTCSPVAFKWTEGKPMVALQVVGVGGAGSTNPPTNRATVVSDDGTIAAGFAENGGVDRSPAVWNADGTGFLIDPLDADNPGEVLSIDTHGETVAGTWWLGEGFTWSKAKGIVHLGKITGATDVEPTFPNAISLDGKLVFGGYGDAFLGTPRAFVWTEKDGIRSLADVATAHGITIPTGWTLGSVLASSVDGSVILGTCSNETGMGKTFVMRLPTSAY